MSEQETQIPTGDTPVAGTSPSSTDELADLEARHAELRAELQAENEKLEGRLAESRATALEAQGLTDEQVRRIEHPAEFTDQA